MTVALISQEIVHISIKVKNKCTQGLDLIFNKNKEPYTCIFRCSKIVLIFSKAHPTNPSR